MPVFSRLGAVPARGCSTGWPRTPPARSGASCSSTGRTRPRWCRSNPAAAALADGPGDIEAWGGMSASPTRTRSWSTRAGLVADAARSAPATPASSARARGPGRCGTGTTARSRSSTCSGPGEISAARRINFERHYDLPERVLPARDPARADAAPARRPSASWSGSPPGPRRGHRARPAGTTSGCRAPTPSCGVAELVEAGELLPVDGRGWTRAGLPVAEARRPRRVAARALLSPFDSLIWFRARTERLFGFHYRIEIYTPAPKRGTATTCCRSCSGRSWWRGST